MSNGDLLNPQAMLQRAEVETGRSNYGDETLSARFALAVDQIKAVGMDEAGQRAAADVCHWLLTSRLAVFEDRNRFPIGDEIIEKPLFATGEARSGTTLLHALLSVDPQARALRFWEIMYPSPPPGLAQTDDERPARADNDWREILEMLPKWLISHPYNDMLGNGLPECERTWAYDFRVMTPTAWWRVPMGINHGNLPTDPMVQYRLHKIMLQQCQYNRPKKHWVLKGFHQERLAALFATYPDANIIWSHRDPVQVIASRTMLMGELIEGLSGKVDWAAMVRASLAGVRQSIAVTMNEPLVQDQRIHHVRYKDFTADPVATIRGFYTKYDVPFPDETEVAMREYLKNNKGDRYGKFKYSTDIIEEDLQALHDEFAPYRERFGVEIERR